MSNRVKNLVMIGIFSVFLFTFFILNLVLPDQDIARYERRKLKKFPKVSYTSVIDGSFMKEFDEYTFDQFPFRDTFRKIKTNFELDVLKKNDVDGTFIYDDGIYKIEYPLNEKAVLNLTTKMNYVIDNYLGGSKKFYTIIPDKNYYLNIDTLKLDYQKLEDLMDSNLDITYIDITDNLTINDYYKTDLHWQAQYLLKIKQYINEKMGNSNKEEVYQVKDEGDFYGAYYGSILKNIEPDRLRYLMNDDITNLVSYDYEKKTYQKIYDLDKLNNIDKYDIFLSGPTPIIEINNFDLNNDKELIIFRDSFASSIAPLFVNDYEKIILVDLRYINTTLLDQFITFNDQDVLFMYSVSIINNSFSMK